MSVGNEIIIGQIVLDIKAEIKELKHFGWSQKKVRKFINKSYIKKELKDSENYCFVGNLKETTSTIWNQVDKVINKQFYSEFDSNEYYAPKIEKINVDTEYEVRQVGNVSEITFKETEKIVDKEITVDYSTEGKSCTEKKKFTEDGKLILSCSFNPNEEFDKE